MIALRFSSGPRAGQTITLRGALATIGRSPSCDVVVNDPMLSAVHATIEQVAAGYIVTDQQSANGTLVNGQRIFRALLRVGDELVIGSVGLVVEGSDGFAATLYGPAPSVQSAPDAMTMMAVPKEHVPVEGTLLFGQTPHANAPARPSAPATAPPPSVLEVLGAMGQGLSAMPIPPGGIVVGRAPECGCVVHDAQVSSRHCKIVVGPEGPVLTDLGSSNGTFVNDERLAPEMPRLLLPSDAVRIGGLALRVREARSAARFVVATVSGAFAAPLEIRPGEPFTIGRLPTSRLTLNDALASSQHCELTQVGATVQLVDGASKNGTFVIAADGTETRLVPGMPHTLRNDDRFRVGGVIFKLVAIRTQPAQFAPSPIAFKQPTAAAARAAAPAPSPATGHVPKSLRGARLTFVAGPRAGTATATVPIEQVTTRVGRGFDNDITLEDPSVSSEHALLVAEEHGFVLRDPGSSNGCWVNGERVDGERVLRSGDLLRFGIDSVCEFVLDGAAADTLAGHVPSVIAHGAAPGKPSPRFVLRGAVVCQERIVVGRDAACDLFIDDPAVARSAVEIVFDGQRFVARALATAGLTVNGVGRADAHLSTGDVLAVGGWSLRVDISGARLTVHEDRVTGGNASWAREVDSAAQAAVVPEAAPFVAAVGGGGGGKAMHQTMFAADASALAALSPKRQKKAAPKWTATSDLLADRGRGGAALIGLGVTALALVGVLVLARGGGPFLGGNLARGHDSARFAALAQEKSLGTGCNSCHTPLRAVASERCQSCHVGFAPKRGLGASAGHDHVTAGLGCGGCHEEHRGAERGQALVALASCAKSGCHDAAHPPHRSLVREAATAFVASVRMPAPATVKMPTGQSKQAQEALHAIHADVNRRCMACHTAADGVSAAPATAACFRCHAEPAVRAGLVAVSDGAVCLGCHAIHNRTLARASDEAIGRRWTRASATGRGNVAVGATLVVALFLFAGGFASSYFGRRVERIARAAESVPSASTPAAAPERAASGEPVPRKNDHAGLKLKVNVNKDKCVGCSNCVNACPTAVLEIVMHKSTVVNEASCTSCRECEAVCPSGALTMAAEGAPPRLIDLPDLDSHYQSNVAGLYLIGEAAGKSLVKNAANLGHTVVEHMVANGLQPGAAARLGADVEVLAIGSGPGGLAAALNARRHGLSVVVVEKDRIFASTIQNCPKGKEFLAEPFDVQNISLLPARDCTKEDLVAEWETLLQKSDVTLRLSEEVLDVRKEGALFCVTTAKGIIKALRVVLAPGTRGSPRKLGVPGQELEKVSYMLIDPGEHQGHHVLVVGGGDSAVECAMALAQQRGNTVTLSYRKEAFARIKPRNQERIDQHIADGTIKVLFNSVPTAVHPNRVVFKVKEGGADKTVELQNQFVYCLLGADLPMVWLQQLGIRYIKKAEGWNPGPTDRIVVERGAVA